MATKLNWKLYKSQMKENSMVLVNKSMQLELDMLSIQINKSNYFAANKHIANIREQLNELDAIIGVFSK